MESLVHFLIILCGFGLISGQTEPIVETNLGKIRGAIMKTDEGSQFLAFRGIRYAEAPIGENRFKPPIAIKKWSGELDATKDGFMCPQIGKLVHLLSEDCLFLNVFSKNTTANHSVMVYLHGGANIKGGSHSVDAAGPEYLIEGNIVLVTINYRLGALGFLSTRTKEAPGNFGHLDQVMALEWVHDHIAKFGGDPRSVTLFGISAGAMAVTLHMVSPLSQGLFHRAVAMSGSATSDLVTDNLYWTRKLAHQTSCPRFNATNMLDCLRKIPWETIIRICDSWQVYNLTDLKWNYEVDGHFLKKIPTSSFADGNFSRIPIITGMTKDEFSISSLVYENNTGFLNDVSLNFDKYAQELFGHNFEDAKMKKAEKVKNFYLGNKSIAEQNLMNFGDIFSDSLINHGVHRFVNLARNYVDVYYYRFDFHGRFGILRELQGDLQLVSHSDDLQYIIKRKKFQSQIKPNDTEWFMVKRMVGIFTSFAQNGSPQNIDGIKWLSSNKSAVHTLYINDKVKLGSEPYTDRLRLWDSFHPISGSDATGPRSLIIALAVIFNIFIYKF